MGPRLEPNGAIAVPSVALKLTLNPETGRMDLAPLPSEDQTRHDKPKRASHLMALPDVRRRGGGCAKNILASRWGTIAGDGAGDPCPDCQPDPPLLPPDYISIASTDDE